MINERFSDNEVVLKASDFAWNAHENQTRKFNGEPYYNHCKRVSLSLCNESNNIRATAYLHDVVEDTNITIGQLLDYGFPYEVVYLVDILTQRQGQDHFNYIQRVLKDIDACKIKLADTRDNISDLPKHMKDKYAKYEFVIDLLKHQIKEI